MRGGWIYKDGIPLPLRTARAYIIYRNEDICNKHHGAGYACTTHNKAESRGNTQRHQGALKKQQKTQGAKNQSRQRQKTTGFPFFVLFFCRLWTCHRM
jgi:hypothetical protein